ncbi:hypothetical protein [Streptomyces mutabilis]|uniref:hypothetical protein n=1 Tax=Streptomyces TaxID=1883 RepID=UPI0017825F1B|nr:hypothetical protein [Streptomyces mutabilis]GGP99742.1 hypothetical protein GCM10010279_03210 [Streptomyces mutabilis]
MATTAWQMLHESLAIPIVGEQSTWARALIAFIVALPSGWAWLWARGQGKGLRPFTRASIITSLQVILLTAGLAALLGALIASPYAALLAGGVGPSILDAERLTGAVKSRRHESEGGTSKSTPGWFRAIQKAALVYGLQRLDARMFQHRNDWCRLRWDLTWTPDEVETKARDLAKELREQDLVKTREEQVWMQGIRQHCADARHWESTGQAFEYRRSLDEAWDQYRIMLVRAYVNGRDSLVPRVQNPRPPL